MAEGGHRIPLSYTASPMPDPAVPVLAWMQWPRLFLIGSDQALPIATAVSDGTQ